MAATSQGYFDNFLSLFVLLFLHLGCFFFSSSGDCSGEQTPSSSSKRRKIPPPSDDSTRDTLKSISFISYLGRLLSFRKPGSDKEQQNHRSLHIQPSGDPLTYPSSPLLVIALSPDAGGGGVPVSAESAATNDSVAAVAVHACPSCGEVLSKRQLLDLHQAAKHSLSELCDSDSGYNIIRIIFDSGWKGKSPPVVRRVLKIQNTARTLARYEEYRDAVRSRAAHYSARTGGGNERCIADGNERLRFYCTTTLCSWNTAAAAATLGVCGSPYCCACAIVRHGFVGKQADIDGIATHATSWGAHASLPEDLEREFACLRARRAMLVCRVVAGRVSHRPHVGVEAEEEEEKGAGFDSVVPTGGDGGGRRHSSVGEDELLVFSPRAVLPCFVIIYTV